ncbi:MULTISPECIES: hypothetical protein [unclassified Streptomyces]
MDVTVADELATIDTVVVHPDHQRQRQRQGFCRR